MALISKHSWQGRQPLADNSCVVLDSEELMFLGATFQVGDEVAMARTDTLQVLSSSTEQSGGLHRLRYL